MLFRKLYGNIVSSTELYGFVYTILAFQRYTEDEMSVQLLDKTRKINKLLHNNNSSKVVFNDICAVLTEILDSNVLVVSRKGKILGVSKCP